MGKSWLIHWYNLYFTATLYILLLMRHLLLLHRAALLIHYIPLLLTSSNCFVPYYTTSNYATLCRIIATGIALYYIVLHHTVSHYITLYHTTLHRITLHYIIYHTPLHCISLYQTVPHWINHIPLHHTASTIPHYTPLPHYHSVTSYITLYYIVLHTCTYITPYCIPSYYTSQ